MQLSGVHHISLNVSDLDQTVEFYTDVLGLEILPRPDDSISVPGRWLGLPDGRQIHLLLNDVPDDKGQHFALEVDSVSDAIDSLAESGLKTSEPSTMPGVCIQAFTRDPSGNLIEFNQRL